MNNRERVYLGISVATALYLAVFGFVVNPFTQMASWEGSPTGNLMLVLLFLVPFIILMWSMVNVLAWVLENTNHWPKRHSRLTRM